MPIRSRDRTKPVRTPQAEIDAFESVYRRSVGRVYALAIRLEGSHSRAEDLTQEVFLKVWRSLPSFREEASLDTWIHTITVRTAIDRYRRAGARPQDEPGRDGALADAIPAAWQPPDVDLERAIARLPDAMRRYFVLHAIEGYHMREIGEMFGVATGTVQSQIFEARRRLRHALGGSHRGA